MSHDVPDAPPLRAIVPPPSWTTGPLLFLACLALLVLTLMAPAIALLPRADSIEQLPKTKTLALYLPLACCLLGVVFSALRVRRGPDPLLAAFGVGGALGGDLATYHFLYENEHPEESLEQLVGLYSQLVFEAGQFGAYLALAIVVLAGVPLHAALRRRLRDPSRLDGDRLVVGYGAALALAACAIWFGGRQASVWGSSHGAPLAVAAGFSAGLGLVAYAAARRASIALALRRSLEGEGRSSKPRSRYRLPPPPDAESRARQRSLYRRALVGAIGLLSGALALLGAAYAAGLVPGGFAEPERLDAGEWRLIAFEDAIASVNPQEKMFYPLRHAKIDPDRAPTLRFNLVRQRASGHDGCNSVYMAINTLKEGRLSFGRGSTTMVNCMDEDTGINEHYFARLLEGTTRYQVADSTLTLSGAPGPLARFVRTPVELRNDTPSSERIQRVRGTRSSQPPPRTMASSPSNDTSTASTQSVQTRASRPVRRS